MLRRYLLYTACFAVIFGFNLYATHDERSLRLSLQRKEASYRESLRPKQVGGVTFVVHDIDSEERWVLHQLNTEAASAAQRSRISLVLVLGVVLLVFLDLFIVGRPWRR